MPPEDTRSDPFDDPELQAFMAENGIVHAPGTAKKHLDEIAPLLAADGIDLNDPESITDLDTLNDALARANAQHNFMLATPVGEQRARAIAVLRTATKAIASDDTTLAQAVLGSIQPDPTDDTPSVSHVIGAALGILDDWYSDPTTNRSLTRTRIPAWSNSQSRKAGTDIIGLARKGRSFDALDSLIRSHRGLAVFEGAALAVAASVIAWAAADGVDAETLTDGILSSPAPGAAPLAPQGASFRKPKPKPNPNPNPKPKPQPQATDTTSAFARWLEQHAPDIAAPAVADELSVFHALVSMAAANELDLNDPDDASFAIDLILDEDAAFSIVALTTLYDYARFRMETSLDPDSWATTLDEIADTLDENEEAPITGPLHDAIEAELQIPEDARHARLAQTRIASAVPALLEWIGTGRTITSTGNLRRADIEPFSALLGITAVGAAKLPAPERVARGPRDPNIPSPEEKIYQVQSLPQVPVPVAWWEALRVTDILSFSSTRVYPGPDADAWRTGEISLVDLDMLVGAFISELLLGAGDNDGYSADRTVGAIQVLVQILDPDAELTPVPAIIDPLAIDIAAFMRPGALRTVHRLADLGILDRQNDRLDAPAELRGTIARGILMALSILDAMLSDEDDPDFD